MSVVVVARGCGGYAGGGGVKRGGADVKLIPANRRSGADKCQSRGWNAGKGRRGGSGASATVGYVLVGYFSPSNIREKCSHRTP